MALRHRIHTAWKGDVPGSDDIIDASEGDEYIAPETDVPSRGGGHVLQQSKDIILFWVVRHDFLHLYLEILQGNYIGTRRLSYRFGAAVFGDVVIHEESDSRVFVRAILANGKTWQTCLPHPERQELLHIDGVTRNSIFDRQGRQLSWWVRWETMTNPIAVAGDDDIILISCGNSCQLLGQRMPMNRQDESIEPVEAMIVGEKSTSSRFMSLTRNLFGTGGKSFVVAMAVLKQDYGFCAFSLSANFELRVESVSLKSQNGSGGSSTLCKENLVPSEIASKASKDAYHVVRACPGAKQGTALVAVYMSLPGASQIHVYSCFMTGSENLIHQRTIFGLPEQLIDLQLEKESLWFAHASGKDSRLRKVDLCCSGSTTDIHVMRINNSDQAFKADFELCEDDVRATCYKFLLLQNHVSRFALNKAVNEWWPESTVSIDSHNSSFKELNDLVDAEQVESPWLDFTKRCLAVQGRHDTTQGIVLDRESNATQVFIINESGVDIVAPLNRLEICYISDERETFNDSQLDPVLQLDIDRFVLLLNLIRQHMDFKVPWEFVNNSHNASAIQADRLLDGEYPDIDNEHDFEAVISSRNGNFARKAQKLLEGITDVATAITEICHQLDLLPLPQIQTSMNISTNFSDVSLSQSKLNAVVSIVTDSVQLRLRLVRDIMIAIAVALRMPEHNIGGLQVRQPLYTISASLEKTIRSLFELECIGSFCSTYSDSSLPLERCMGDPHFFSVVQDLDECATIDEIANMCTKTFIQHPLLLAWTLHWTKQTEALLQLGARSKSIKGELCYLLANARLQNEELNKARVLFKRGASVYEEDCAEIIKCDLLEKNLYLSETQISTESIDENNVGIYYIAIMRMFLKHGRGESDECRSQIPEIVIDFARAAIPYFVEDNDWHRSLRNILQSNIFDCALACGDKDTAFSALVDCADPAIKKAHLQRFITVLSERSEYRAIVEYPYSALISKNGMESPDQIIEDFLKQLIRIPQGVAKFGPDKCALSYVGLQTSKRAADVLYAFHIHRSNYQGAARVMYKFADEVRKALDQHLTEIPKGIDAPDKSVLETLQNLRHQLLLEIKYSLLAAENSLLVTGNSEPYSLLCAKVQEPELQLEHESVSESSNSIAIELLRVHAELDLLQYSKTWISKRNDVVLIKALCKTELYDRGYQLACAQSSNQIQFIEQVLVNLTEFCMLIEHDPGYKESKAFTSNHISLTGSANIRAWSLLRAYLEDADELFVHKFHLKFYEVVARTILKKPFALPFWIVEGLSHTPNGAGVLLRLYLELCEDLHPAVALTERLLDAYDLDSEGPNKRGRTWVHLNNWLPLTELEILRARPDVDLELRQRLENLLM